MAEAEPQGGNVNLLRLSVHLAELQERRKAADNFAQAIVDETSGNEQEAKKAHEAVEEADSKADFLQSEGGRFLRALDSRNITLPLGALRVLVAPNSSLTDGVMLAQEVKVLPAPQITSPAPTAEEESQLPKILIDLQTRIATNPAKQPPTFIKAIRGSFLWDLLIMLSHSDIKTGVGKIDIDPLLLSHHLKPSTLHASISNIRSKLELDPQKPVLIKTIRSGDEYDEYRYFRRFAVEEVGNLWNSWNNARNSINRTISGPSQEELAALERAGIEVEEDLLPPAAPPAPAPSATTTSPNPAYPSTNGVTVTQEDITRETRIEKALQRREDEELTRINLRLARSILAALYAHRTLRSLEHDPRSIVKLASGGTDLGRKYQVEMREKDSGQAFAKKAITDAALEIFNNPDSIPQTQEYSFLRRSVEGLRNSSWSTQDIASTIADRWSSC